MLAKNFDDFSNKLITDGNLSRLNIHILQPSYLEAERSCFIEVIKDKNKELDQDAKEKPMISDLKDKSH